MATRRYQRIPSANIQSFGVTRKTIDWLKNVKIEDLKVQVGVYEGKYYDRNGKRVSLVKVAKINEYGAPRRNIPPRPIFRYARTELTKSGELQRILEEDLIDKTKRISNSRKKINIPEKTKHKLGQAVVEELRKRVDKKTSPRNKPATIRKKGRDDPLVDTKKMLREGFDYKIDGKKQNYRGKFIR